MYQIIAANYFSLTRRHQMMVTAVLLALAVSILLVIIFTSDVSILAKLNGGITIAVIPPWDYPILPPFMA